MRWTSPVLLFLLAASSQADETLRYSIKWPAGASMGHGELRTLQGGSKIEFELDASLPAIAVKGDFSSKLNKESCTSEFVKKYEFGFRTSSERTTVDGTKARRETDKGGNSVMDVGPCAKDGLAFLEFLRGELKAGRKPASYTVLFGAKYNLSLSYPAAATGADADTVRITIKGPASQNSVEIDFLRDAARTPARVRVPMPIGKFGLELVR